MSSTKRERSWRLTARPHISDEEGEESCRAEPARAIDFWEGYMSAAAESRFQQRARNMEPFWYLVGHNVNEGFRPCEHKLPLGTFFKWWWCNSVEKTYHGRSVWKKLFLRVKWSSKLDSVKYYHGATCSNDLVISLINTPANFLAAHILQVIRSLCVYGVIKPSSFGCKMVLWVQLSWTSGVRCHIHSTVLYWMMKSYTLNFKNWFLNNKVPFESRVRKNTGMEIISLAICYRYFAIRYWYFY